MMLSHAIEDASYRVLEAACVLEAVAILDRDASLGAAGAGPLPSSTSPDVSKFESVQYRRDRDWQGGREYRGREYYNGHRGFRDRRPGYRYQNGFWFPLAAFGAGALIGGAVSSQPRYTSEPRAMGGNMHAQWCAERYQTYRAYDNTYVPRAGVRAKCDSPYS